VRHVGLRSRTGGFVLPIVNAGLEDVKARGQILPVAGIFVTIALRLPAQVHHGRYHPDRQNDSNADQGKREEDDERFHAWAAETRRWNCNPDRMAF
jgi:hypothetical protein